MTYIIKSKIFQRSFEFKFNQKYLGNNTSPHNLTWSYVYLWSDKSNSYENIYNRDGYVITAYTEDEASKLIVKYYRDITNQTKK